MNDLKIYRLDKRDITEEIFRQIVFVEQSGNADCYTKEQLKEIWLESDKNDNFICVCENKIVAHISFNPFSKRRNGSIYVVNLIVLPEYRRQGIAQKLIENGCKYYMERGFELPICISVDKDNTPALNLYKKIGFEVREPICELDYDDTQYILDVSLQLLSQNIDNNFDLINSKNI